MNIKAIVRRDLYRQMIAATATRSDNTDIVFDSLKRNER